jgi:hypothetical protein
MLVAMSFRSSLIRTIAREFQLLHDHKRYVNIRARIRSLYMGSQNRALLVNLESDGSGGKQDSGVRFFS